MIGIESQLLCGGFPVCQRYTRRQKSLLYSFPLSPSSSGQGRHPFKVDIAGSNPAGGTTESEKPVTNSVAGFLLPMRRDSNPTGCGAEETRSVFQRSTRGAERRSGARAAPAARGHPSSPTTELETVLARGPFLFTPGTWDSNPSARLSQRPWPLQIYGKKGSRPSNHASNDALTIWNPFKLAMFCSRYAKTPARISIRLSTSASSHTSGGRKRSV